MLKHHWKKFMWALVLTPLVVFVVTVVSIVYDGFTDELSHADAALILGNKVNVDGTPSNQLRGRLEAGLALYNDGYVPKIVVSGGLGKEGHPEGDAMAAYLVKHGVPAEAIIIDNEGQNTYLTARNFVPIAEAHDIRSVLIVSQFFHISRTRLILKKFGVENIGAVRSKSYHRRDFYSIVREFFAYWKYLLAY